MAVDEMKLMLMEDAINSYIEVVKQGFANVFDPVINDSLITALEMAKVVMIAKTRIEMMSTVDPNTDGFPHF